MCCVCHGYWEREREKKKHSKTNFLLMLSRVFQWQSGTMRRQKQNSATQRQSWSNQWRFQPHYWHTLHLVLLFLFGSLQTGYSHKQQETKAVISLKLGNMKCSLSPRTNTTRPHRVKMLKCWFSCRGNRCSKESLKRYSGQKPTVWPVCCCMQLVMWSKGMTRRYQCSYHPMHSTFQKTDNMEQSLHTFVCVCASETMADNRLLWKIIQSGRRSLRFGTFLQCWPHVFFFFF